MIAATKSSIANSANILRITDNLDVCCNGATVNNYATANFDSTLADLEEINIQAPGGSAQTVAIDGAPLDWGDSANDATVIAAIGKAAEDAGYNWFGGGIELDRSAGGNNLSVVVKESTLIFNWIGKNTTSERAFVATEVK